MTIAVPRLNRVPAIERGITIGDFLVPIGVGERLSSRSRHVALVLAGALVIALTAAISIRLPNTPVPITGQTFGVLAVGTALGLRRGFLAVLLYIVIGAIGLPAFAEHKAGIAVLASVQDGRLVLGATGGYLVGFILAGAVVGRLAELGWDRRFAGSIAAMAIGNVLVYAIGLPWLAASTGMSASDAVANGLTPFIAGDVLKLAIAAGIFPMAWWIVAHRTAER